MIICIRVFLSWWTPTSNQSNQWVLAALCQAKKAVKLSADEMKILESAGYAWGATEQLSWRCRKKGAFEVDFHGFLGTDGISGNGRESTDFLVKFWHFAFFFGEWTLGMILERRLESWQRNCIIHHDTLPTIMAQWICFLGNWKWLPNCYDRFHFQQNWMQWLGSKSAQRYKRRGSLISRREKACPSRSRQGKEEKSLILHGGYLHFSNWITYASGSTTLIWCLSNRLSWIAVGICLDVGTLLGGSSTSWWRLIQGLIHQNYPKLNKMVPPSGWLARQQWWNDMKCSDVHHKYHKFLDTSSAPVGLVGIWTRVRIWVETSMLLF